MGLPKATNPKSVFAAARKGEAKALRVVDVVAERIALALAAVVPLADPDLVILGGGIGRNGDLLLDPVVTQLRGLLPFYPPVDVSSLGADAELHGAVAMALQAAQEQLFARPA